LKDDKHIEAKYSESGWIDIDIRKYILVCIKEITLNHPSILILDEYSVHTEKTILDKANKYNINLIYVPPNTTYRNQPLDVSINGPIKSIGKKISKQMLIDDPYYNLTIEDFKILIILISDLQNRLSR
jgi:DDE superfamily endonuclease